MEKKMLYMLKTMWIIIIHDIYLTRQSIIGFLLLENSNMFFVSSQTSTVVKIFFK